MRHCATSRKVAGSLPDGVTGIFHCHNPSGLGLTQHLTEISTRNIFWGLGWPVRRVTTVPPSCADCLANWKPQPPGTLRACPGIALPLLLLNYNKFSHVSCCKQPHFTSPSARSFTDSRNSSVGQKLTVAALSLPFLDTAQYSTGLISKEIQQTAYVKLRQVEKPVHTRKRNRLSTNTKSNTKNQLRKNGKTKLT